MADETIDIRELRKSLLGEDEFRRAYLNEWVKPIECQPIYLLASNYPIANAIFNHYFLCTGHSRRIDLRYIDNISRVYGLRNQYIVISEERYPNASFYERLYFLEAQAKYREFELVYEQDLEKEQVREKVSRQRPQEPKEQ